MYLLLLLFKETGVSLMRMSTDIKSQESYKDNKADVKLIWRGRIGLIIMTMKATFFFRKKHP